MTILHKKEFGKIIYWEAWMDEGSTAVHWGTLGEEGDSKRIKNTFFNKTSKLVKEEDAYMRQLGFEEIDFEDYKLVIVQYKISEDGFGTESDLNKRHEIEDELDELLMKTGNGECDGGESGSGIMNIFCYVVDSDIASRVIINALTEKGWISGALIFETSEGKKRLLWPLDYKGEIDYM